jgi:hypothetical protein
MVYDIVIVALVLLAIWGFASITGLSTRWLSRRTDRSAESMYPQYAGRGRRRRLHLPHRGRA